VVLHVLADAAQLKDYRRADAPEMLRVADSHGCRISSEPTAPADKIASRPAVIGTI